MITALLMFAAPLLWGDLKPGVYDVGFRVIYATSGHRPIRISIWYPAASGGTPMRYGDYFHYEGPPPFTAVNAALEKSDRESYLKDFNDVSPDGEEIYKRLIATPVAARKDATPARGPFPLVLYSGGLGSRSDANVELGEFLASHGYVVATVPQLGPWPASVDLGGSAADIELHARDFEFAFQQLRALSNVDATRVATIGHSVGGIVALDLASRIPRVRAVVGLDGSYGFSGGAKRIDALRGYDPNRVRAPLLDLRRANGVQGAVLDSAALDALTHAERYVVEFPRMFHGDFTEFGTMGLRLKVPLPPNNDGRTRETGYEGNQRAYRAVVDFLDAQLYGRRDRLRQLRADVGDASFTREAEQ